VVERAHREERDERDPVDERAEAGARRRGAEDEDGPRGRRDERCDLVEDASEEGLGRGHVTIPT
jgi:hypothetical protein